MTAWCAQDTLFLPAMLRKTATVESESPLSKDKIRMRVGPEGVREVDPAGTAMSMVIVDPDTAEMSSAADIMMTFCRNIHFFACGDEVARWAAGRDDIMTLSLDQAFELGRRLWPEAYAYAETLERT
jgi:alkylmercury lyase